MENRNENSNIIEVQKGGPIKVTGSFSLTGVDGQKLSVPNQGVIYLCACGRSKNKPFCDGEHTKVSKG